MEDMIIIIFCISFIVLCFANISLMLIDERKAARRFEELAKEKEND